MHGELSKDNEQEELVVEESLEDVNFSCSDSSAIDLIEDLHHHEGIEHEGIVSILVGMSSIQFSYV